MPGTDPICHLYQSCKDKMLVSIPSNSQPKRIGGQWCGTHDRGMAVLEDNGAVYMTGGWRHTELEDNGAVYMTGGTQMMARI